jgi:hypothetical protein
MEFSAQERSSHMLNQLKGVVLPRTDVEEMVALLAFAEGMKAKYIELELDVPEWLEDKVSAIEKEVRSRSHDALLARIRQAESRLEAMKPAEQKRTELSKEIKRLKALAGK